MKWLNIGNPPPLKKYYGNDQWKITDVVLLRLRDEGFAVGWGLQCFPSGGIVWRTTSNNYLTAEPEWWCAIEFSKDTTTGSKL